MQFLRSVTRAPWYVSNFTIHNDLQIPFVIEENIDCQQATIKVYSDTITDYL
jgi:vancomycin resistance protein YoaR